MAAKQQDLNEMVRALEGLEDSMLCTVCMERGLDVALVPCGHMFCKECVEEWTKQSSGICPSCNQSFTEVTKVVPTVSADELNVVTKALRVAGAEQ